MTLTEMLRRFPTTDSTTPDRIADGLLNGTLAESDARQHPDYRMARSGLRSVLEDAAAYAAAIGSNWGRN